VKSATAWLTLAFFVSVFFAGIVLTASLAYSGQAGRMMVISYLLLIPVLYACVGLLTAITVCLLYNALNAALGGIVLEVADSKMSSQLPPYLPANGPQMNLRQLDPNEKNCCSLTASMVACRLDI